MSSWTFRTETSRDVVFGSQLADWQMLHDVQGEQHHVFNHPQVISAWVATFGKVQNIRLLWVWGDSDDGNRSIWPLVLWRRNWKNAFLRVLMPAGGGDYDYHNPVFLQPCNLSDYYTQLLRYLKTHVAFDELRLEGIRDTMVAETAEGAWTAGELCPLLHLDTINTAADLLPRLRTSLRGDLRRQMRRIEAELGELQLVEVTTHSDAMRYYRPFMDAHRQRWPKAYKTPGFHDALLCDSLLQRPVSFTVLMAGDKQLAWHLGFEDSRAYYYYMPAGNPDFLAYSPVKVHLLKLMERAIDHGLTVYDHLRGEETYKSGWSDATQRVNTLSYTPSTLLSRLRHLALLIKKINQDVVSL